MTDDLVERLRHADQHSVQRMNGSRIFGEAADAILKLQAEIARCHERLEIDHYFKIGDNDDSDLERVDIPMSERASFPDAVRARDATIGLIEEDNRDLRTRLEAAEAEVARMRTALEPFVKIEEQMRGTILTDDYKVHTVVGREVTVHLTLGDFRRARSALQGQRT